MQRLIQDIGPTAYINDELLRDSFIARRARIFIDARVDPAWEGPVGVYAVVMAEVPFTDVPGTEDVYYTELIKVSIDPNPVGDDKHFVGGIDLDDLNYDRVLLRVGVNVSGTADVDHAYVDGDEPPSNHQLRARVICEL